MESLVDMVYYSSPQMPASENINTTSSETLILSVRHIRSPLCSSNQAELSTIEEGVNTSVFAKICILAPNCHQYWVHSVLSIGSAINSDMIPPAEIS